MNHDMAVQVKEQIPYSGGVIQRHCDKCRNKKQFLQRSAVRPAPNVMPPIVHEALRSPGQPLDVKTRAFMEPRFGHDFSEVRVHTDSKAAESARAVNAMAYTVGRDVVFSTGRFTSGTNADQQLLAHELAHVVQQTKKSAGSISQSHSDSLEQDAKHAASALTVNGDLIKITGSSAPGIAYAPEPNTGETIPLRHHGLTKAEKKLLKQVRQRLIGDNKKSTAIVGVLITDDGKQFEFKSGGGQGFSSHIEGKATAKMNELGITKATLLVEKEPCQYCDRSVYPSETGPISPLKSSRTGEPIDRQTSRINSALPTGSRLTVADPEAASTYWGIKSAPRTIRSAEPKPVARGAGVKTPIETAAEPTVSGAKPTARTTIEPSTSGITTPKKVAPEHLTTPKATSPKIGAVEGIPEEVSIPKSVRGSRISTAVGIFQISLLLLQFLPDPVEQQAIKKGLDERLKDPKWRARFNELEPMVQQSSSVAYYAIKFKIHYSAYQHPHWRASPIYTVNGIEIQEINVGSDKIEGCGKLDPPSRPNNLELPRGLGTAYGWKASRNCTISILRDKPEIGPTYALTGDREIRNVIKSADPASIVRIPIAEKVRIINRLFDGVVSGSDIEAIRKIYQNTPPNQRHEVKLAIERRIPDLWGPGRRTEVRAILAGGR